MPHVSMPTPISISRPSSIYADSRARDPDEILKDNLRTCLEHDLRRRVESMTVVAEEEPTTSDHREILDVVISIILDFLRQQASITGNIRKADEEHTPFVPSPAVSGQGSDGRSGYRRARAAHEGGEPDGPKENAEAGEGDTKSRQSHSHISPRQPLHSKSQISRENPSIYLGHTSTSQPVEDEGEEERDGSQRYSPSQVPRSRGSSSQASARPSIRIVPEHYGSVNGASSSGSDAGLPHASSLNLDQYHGSSFAHSDTEHLAVHNHCPIVSNIAPYSRRNSIHLPYCYDAVEAERIEVARHAEASANMHHAAVRKQVVETKHKDAEAKEREAEAQYEVEEARRRVSEVGRQEEIDKRNEGVTHKQEEEARQKEDDARRREDNARRRLQNTRQRDTLSRQRAAEARRLDEECRLKEKRDLEEKRREEQREAEARRFEEECRLKAKRDLEEKRREEQRYQREREERSRREELRRQEQARLDRKQQELLDEKLRRLEQERLDKVRIREEKEREENRFRKDQQRYKTLINTNEDIPGQPKDFGRKMDRERRNNTGAAFGIPIQHRQPGAPAGNRPGVHSKPNPTLPNTRQFKRVPIPYPSTGKSEKEESVKLGRRGNPSGTKKGASQADSELEDEEWDRRAEEWARQQPEEPRRAKDPNAKFVPKKTAPTDGARATGSSGNTKGFDRIIPRVFQSSKR